MVVVRRVWGGYVWSGCALRMAQETLDHLTDPVITEVWTLRPREQRLCWIGSC